MEIDKEFIVTVLRTERVSFDELKDVSYSKIFDINCDMEFILTWATSVLKSDYYGERQADLKDLRFSKLIV